MSQTITPARQQKLRDIVVLTSCISAILSLFIIFSYFKFASLRKRSFELVLMLAFFDLLYSVAYAINTKAVTGDLLCTIQVRSTRTEIHFSGPPDSLLL